MSAQEQAPKAEDEFSHYVRDITHLKKLDVYRVLDLFQVSSAPIQHAIKKLMVPGKRGTKDIDQDVAEAIKSLQRFQAMRREDAEADQLSKLSKLAAERSALLLLSGGCAPA